MLRDLLEKYPWLLVLLIVEVAYITGFYKVVGYTYLAVGALAVAGGTILMPVLLGAILFRGSHKKRRVNRPK